MKKSLVVFAIIVSVLFPLLPTPMDAENSGFSWLELLGDTPITIPGELQADGFNAVGKVRAGLG